MSKLFITVLGTSRYFDCNYLDENKSFRTPFIQEALINFLYIDKKIDFDMKILLTDKAYEENYKPEGKLKDILNQYNISHELVFIPEGKTPDELWQIFDELSKTIEESANKLDNNKKALDITIDITHSLRNIPMQIVSAINYLSLFEKINVEGIYYGAFELGETIIDEKIFNNKSILDRLSNKTNSDPKIINRLKSANSINDLDEYTIDTVINNFRNYPGCTIKNALICNLNTYYDLMKWTNAINSFINCGNTTEIMFLSNMLKSNNFGNHHDIKLINNVVKSLDNFTNCINTCRGMCGKRANTDFNSIKISADVLNDNLQNLTKNISVKPLKKLFTLVEDKIKPFIKQDNLGIGLATINWCIDYNLYQQGYTALEETIKTLLCVKLNYLFDNKDDSPENSFYYREDIADKILTSAMIKMANNSNSRKGKEKNLIVDKYSISNNKSDLDLYIEDCVDKLATTKNFCKFAQSVKSFRNDLNHYGFNRDTAKKYDIFSKKLKSFYKQLVEFSKGEFPWGVIDENTEHKVATDISDI
ncbi:hypothetical protein [Intestinibacter sp.]